MSTIDFDSFVDSYVGQTLEESQFKELITLERMFLYDAHPRLYVRSYAETKGAATDYYTLFTVARKGEAKEDVKIRQLKHLSKVRPELFISEIHGLFQNTFSWKDVEFRAKIDDEVTKLITAKPILDKLASISTQLNQLALQVAGIHFQRVEAERKVAQECGLEKQGQENTRLKETHKWELHEVNKNQHVVENIISQYPNISVRPLHSEIQTSFIAELMRNNEEELRANSDKYKEQTEAYMEKIKGVKQVEAKLLKPIKRKIEKFQKELERNIQKHALDMALAQFKIMNSYKKVIDDKEVMGL